jgi:DNA (cytosine-5)-methyltransferase 1
LPKTKFNTVFANDIQQATQIAWTNYFSHKGINFDVYHLDSIVNLVKRQQMGEDIFPQNIDVVIGGFPCQDFSVAGKRLGFNSN